MKGRILLFLILAILVVLVALYALRKAASPDSTTAKLEHLTPEMQRLVPTEWTTLESTKCDFDGDAEEEGLLLYRYDLAATEKPEEADTILKRGLIGAAIYDAQVSPLSAQPATAQPYRPTEIITYRLLPDFYAGKGQGYIGEAEAKWYLFQSAVTDGKCHAKELAVLGYSGSYSDSDLPTRLSLFRWEPAKKTYLAAHFVGNAWIEVDVKDSARKQVTQVVTYNRLNDRSLLCEVRTYQRPAGAEHINFTEDGNAFSLDFCFDTPGDPTYPEGAVVAYLRNSKPVKENDGQLLPGDSFLLPGAPLPPGIAPPLGILSITHSAAVTSATGSVCDAFLGGAAQWWWCGRETAEVTTEVLIAGSARTLTWTLISITPNAANADVGWRILKVE